MQSNPIQQRIESVCEQWEDAKKFKSARIVRIQCQPDEHDMVDTFYIYMIGMDTPVMDISFHFDSICRDVNTYSMDLLKELDELISIWNNSEKEKGITHFDINWKANFNINDKKNPALLFVANFNKLADVLDLNDNLFSVAILKSPTSQEQIKWLKSALDAGISEKVKILIYDSIDDPAYNQFCFSNPLQTTTIALNLNMDKAMEQAAAMGDPKDPATPYRQAFMKMMNAMAKNKETETELHANTCLNIATKNTERDPYWTVQIIVILLMLGNDKLKYKKKSEALDYANHAVKLAGETKGALDDKAEQALSAQALMFRATLLFTNGDYVNSFKDYQTCFSIYSLQNNFHLAVESCRMAGVCANKRTEVGNAAEILCSGFKLAKKVTPPTIKSSTFAGLVDELLKTNYQNYIPNEELEEEGNRIYGSEWHTIVQNWKTPTSEYEAAIS